MIQEHDRAGDALARYRALERHCERMLEAARDDDWLRVQRLGSQTQALIAELRGQASAAMDPATRSEKFRLLRSIVRLDAQIRHLAQPWTRAVDRMFGGESGGLPPHPRRS